MIFAECCNRLHEEVSPRATATFCVAIGCASGMSRRWQFSPGGTNFCCRRRSRRRIFFLSIEKRRCQACGWPVRHVIFATEIRTPGESSSRHGATRPSVSKRDSLSFGMDYRRGAALETIYRYDISRAVLSLCNAILYNLPGGEQITRISDLVVSPVQGNETLRDGTGERLPSLAHKFGTDNIISVVNVVRCLRRKCRGKIPIEPRYRRIIKSKSAVRYTVPWKRCVFPSHRGTRGLW